MRLKSEEDVMYLSDILQLPIEISLPCKSCGKEILINQGSIEDSDLIPHDQKSWYLSQWCLREAVGTYKFSVCASEKALLVYASNAWGSLDRICSCQKITFETVTRYDSFFSGLQVYAGKNTPWIDNLHGCLDPQNQICGSDRPLGSIGIWAYGPIYGDFSGDIWSHRGKDGKRYAIKNKVEERLDDSNKYREYICSVENLLGIWVTNTDFLKDNIEVAKAHGVPLYMRPLDWHEGGTSPIDWRLLWSPEMEYYEYDLTGMYS